MAESTNFCDDDDDDVSLTKARIAAKKLEIEGYLDPDSDRAPTTGPPQQRHEGRRQIHEQPLQSQQQQQQLPRRPEQLSNGHRPNQTEEIPKNSSETIKDPLAGIEWEYADDPDDSLLCEICFSLPEDPRLLNCCGEHNACSTCIDKAAVRNKACPFCRAENFKLIPNNNVKKAIENLRVYCPQKANGCDWKGKKSQAIVHLSECRFAMMMCPQGCGMTFKRCELDEHKLACSNLPVSCRFVAIGCKGKFPQKEALLHNEDNIHNHLLQVVRRNEAIRKVALSSSQEVIKSAEKSLTDKLSKLEELKKQLANSQRNVRSLEQKIDSAKQQLYAIREEHHTKGVHYTAQLQAKGKEVLQLLTTSRGIEGVIEKLPIPPVEGYTAIPAAFTIDNFASRKQNDEIWVSPPFYTHVAGYKMRIDVYPNGDSTGRGTHVSVYLHMLQGENDDYLPWPFPGAVITILFLNQRGVMKNMVLESFGHAAAYLTIEAGEPSDQQFCQRVTNGTYGQGLGFRKLIPNSKIGRYVINDTLRVKLHKIDFLPL